MKNNILFDFVDAINTANVDKMCKLMAEDHVFIDSQDNRTVGRENMRQAWIGYFDLFPDYKIEIEEIFEKDSFICFLGHASATYKKIADRDNSYYWRIPAAWTAIIKDHQVTKWQVYADNLIVLNIMQRVENLQI